MSMSGTEREPESTAPDVSAVTGLRPGDSSTSTIPPRRDAAVAKAAGAATASPAAAESETV